MSEEVLVVVGILVGGLIGWSLRPVVARYDAAVSPKWPLPEVACAALFGLTIARYDWWEVMPVLGLVTATVALSIVDIRQYRLPNDIVFSALGAVGAAIVLGELIDGDVEVITYAATGMAVYFGVLFAMHLISPAGMGFGDVKLALVLGLVLGWVATSRLDAVRAVMIALLIGSAFGVALGLGRMAVLALGKSFLPDPYEGSAGPKRRQTTFPFGPPLMLGTLLVVLYPATFLG